MTQPKNRGLAEPRMPPSASRTSSSITASGAMPDSGSGFANRRRSSSIVAVVAIGRDGSASRYRAA